MLTLGDVLIAMGLLMMFGYLRGVPDRVHKKAIVKYEQDLAAELEGVRADLQRELELLRISQEQLQVQKTREFLELSTWFNDYMVNSQKLRAASRDEKKRREFVRRMVDLGTRLYLFAGDEAVRKYAEWREMTQRAAGDGVNRLLPLVLYAELMTEVRRDVGYPETKCTSVDFLKAILTNIADEDEVFMLAASRAEGSAEDHEQESALM